MSMPNCKLPNNTKFEALIDMPTLGLGTIWLGRRWPENNSDYNKPSGEEIESYLSEAYNSGIRMIDTAAAYGASEQVLGRYLSPHSERIGELFIATKWGEEFDVDLEKSTTDHSVKQLEFSLKRSLAHLPKIDLLYIHKANKDVLCDLGVREKMLQLKQDKTIMYTGASISTEGDLKGALDKDCLWVDFIQTNAALVRTRPEILKAIFDKGIAVVVNSPVRALSGRGTPKDSCLGLSTNPHVSFILTGTRNHLVETVHYFSEV